MALYKLTTFWWSLLPGAYGAYGLLLLPTCSKRMCICLPYTIYCCLSMKWWNHRSLSWVADSRYHSFVVLHHPTSDTTSKNSAKSASSFNLVQRQRSSLAPWVTVLAYCRFISPFQAFLGRHQYRRSGGSFLLDLTCFSRPSTFHLPAKKIYFWRLTTVHGRMSI